MTCQCLTSGCDTVLGVEHPEWHFLGRAVTGAVAAFWRRGNRNVGQKASDPVELDVLSETGVRAEETVLERGTFLLKKLIEELSKTLTA